MRVYANVLFTNKKLTMRMVDEIREVLSENYEVDSGVKLPLNKVSEAHVFANQYYRQDEVSDC